MSRLVCFPFVGDSVGGAHVSAALLIRALDSTRYSPLVVVHERGPLTKYLEGEDIPFELLPIRGYVGSSTGLGHVGDLRATLGPVKRFIDDRRITIVHGNDTRINQTWIMPSRLARKPFIWHQRSLLSTSLLTRIGVRASTAVIAISRTVASSFGSAPRPTVIPNPFDTASPPPDRADARRHVATELGVPSDTCLAGYFGRLTPRKRPDMFLAVASELARRNEGSVVFPMFTPVGRDRDFDLQREISDRGLGGVVVPMGFRAPVGPWMAACDVILAPAEDEPFGRVVVEAMLNQTPVVAARSGAHPEIIASGETGILVEPGDHAAMAHAVSRLLISPAEAERIRKNARADAVQRYSVDRHVESIVEVYDSISA